MGEVVGTFGGAEGIEDVADGVPEQVDASGCGASEQGLQSPIRSGWIVPRWCQRCISLTTKLVLTSNLAAAAPRDAPPATARTTRARRSTEYGRALRCWSPRPSSPFESQQPHVVNPKPIPLARISQTRKRDGGFEQDWRGEGGG
jgi:hypothetical protein